MFDLEQSIQSWKRQLRSSSAFEDGDVEELESHLRDEIRELTQKGVSDTEAFREAAEKLGLPAEVGNEMLKVRARKLPSGKPRHTGGSAMLWPNYLKVAFRNLYRDRANTFINIFGLTIALLSCMVIFLYVENELNVDSFHPDADRLYRLTYEELNRPGARYFATTSPPMGPALSEDFPEVEKAVRFRFTDSNIMKHGNRQFYEYGVVYADSTFLSMFNFPLALGDPETALSKVNSIILTKSTAKKYFGNENPLGKDIILDNIKTLTVTGVFKPITRKTHLKFDCIISFSSFEVPRGYPTTLDDWGWVSFYTYVLLREGAEPSSLEDKFPAFLSSRWDPKMAQNTKLHLQPLQDIYLEPNLVNAGTDLAVGNRSYIYGLAAIAFFILLIAGFNFMNLSTAQSLRRGKEVGIRKTLGARRGWLIGQFIGESMLISFISTILALLFVFPFINYISFLLDARIPVTTATFKEVIPVFCGTSLLVGVLAGIYPAFILSGFSPSIVMKGSEQGNKRSVNLRTVLVVAQFSIAIALIAGSLLIRKQIKFIQDKDLGFDKEHVLVLHMDGHELTRRYQTIRQQLLTNPNVMSASLGGGLLDGRNGDVPIYPQEKNADPQGYPMQIYGVKYHFIETLKVPIVSGRNFSEAIRTDSADGIIINETAARIFGWKSPLGKKLRVGDIMDGRVIGVARDFNFSSLHNPIQPLVMYIPPTDMSELFIRLQPGSLGARLSSLEKSWKRVVPDFPFSYRFLDQHLNQLYLRDQRFFQLLTIFTLLTILIACLGLYGLISYFIQRRVKEIGIRKILGATTTHISLLLSRRFLMLVALGNVIAWPMAYLLIARWLQNFAYHTEISLSIFLEAALLTLLIAFIPMSVKTIRAALMNPVNSLRSE